MVTAKRGLFEILGGVDSNVVGPRIGRMVLNGRKDVQTPNFFALASRGAVPHITPDVISSCTDILGVHMALEDFIERSEAKAPILSWPPNQSPLHSFTALPSSITTLLAPRRSPAVKPPSGNSDSSISIYTSTGFQTLDNSRYNSFVQKLAPDIAISMADLTYSNPGVKRTAKMGDRTQLWLTQLINSKSPEQIVFAPVLPIDFNSQAEYMNTVADEFADEIQGLALYDSDILPEIPATTAISRLLRLSLDEPTTPHKILREVSLGMDLFTVPFISTTTDSGIALTFRFPGPLPGDENAPAIEGTGILPLGIDMWGSEHATSLLPLSTSCTCYTCTSHHRAYIQHLLSAKEMTGWVLLQIHNHHILSEFFAAVRESIRKGSFDADCETFSAAYESELPAKTGQGPRVRGYHFKSEGPGEKKRNKAPWGNLGGDDPDDTPGMTPIESAKDLVDIGFAETAEGGKK
ncbi:putative Queuine tRNA-ribosyltransferase-like protein [Xylogone sp. PMI_703]|nr:putative Queuine tRNA-ribosyltransferase-like protein [Xylogone sp. PMI_703]